MLTVAVDDRRLVLHQLADKLGNHGRVGPVGVLPPTKYIEVPQSDEIEAVGFLKHIGVQFVDVLRNRVGRERLSDNVLSFGHGGRVAVSGATAGEDKALYLSILGGYQHIQEAADVDRICSNRVGDGTRHRTQSRLMQHIIRPSHCFVAIGQFPDVAFDQSKIGVCQEWLDVASFARGKIIQARHPVAFLEQSLTQIGADRTSPPRHYYVLAADHIGCFL